jgi:hypothetical protein
MLLADAALGWMKVHETKLAIRRWRAMSRGSEKGNKSGLSVRCDV